MVSVRMSKKRVNISVDPDVHAKAKQLGFNISGVAEHALRTTSKRFSTAISPHPHPS